MSKVGDILNAAQMLSADERRRLMVELDALEPLARSDMPPNPSPLQALRTLSGAAHSDYTDLSTDKYAHVAAAAVEPER